MARTPVWSEPLPSGAVRFGYDDGSTQDAPPSEYTSQISASLPDRMAGATAQNAYTAPPPTGNPYLDLPMPAPPPVATDATGAGGAPGDAPNAGAGGANWWERTYAPGEEPITPASGGTPGAGNVGGLPSNPVYSRAEPPPEPPPATYAPNPNEGGAAPPQRRAQVIRTPGGWVPTARQTQFTETPPEVEEGLKSALESEYQAGQTRSMATREAEDRKLAQDQATAVALRYEEDQQAKRDAERRARAQQEFEKIRREVDDVGQMRINPNAYWESKSTFQKVGLAIALGITNAAGMPGLQNMINGEIAANIDAQKSNKMIGDKRVSDKLNVYKEMLERFGDDQSAELAATAVYQRQIARQAELTAKRLEASDPMRAARSLDLKAAFDRAVAETEKALHSRQVTSGEAYQAPRTMIVGGGAAKGKDDAARYVPGYGTALTPEDAKKARAAIAAANNVTSTVARIKSLTATVGDRLTPAQRAAAASERANLILQLKEAMQMGTVDKGLLEIANDLLGDPTSVTDFGGRTAGIDAVADQTSRGLKSQLESMGLTPAGRAITPDGKPVVTPTGAQPMVPVKPTPVSGFRGAGQ